jgi:hypothetical protein
MSWRKRSSRRPEENLLGEMAGEYKVKVLHADRGVDVMGRAARAGVAKRHGSAATRS